MPKSFDSLIFDLDGTLWDTSEACARGWNDVVERQGLVFRKIHADDVRAVMGKPHEVIEDNRAVLEYGGRLYDGVVEGLNALRAEYRLYIVSNCQAGYIETFIQYAQLHDVFSDYECWGNTGQSKDRNLAALIQRNALTAPLMVGDMESDRAAARACDVEFWHAAARCLASGLFNRFTT
jgi:phosphoglycolate phosphatase